MSQESIEASKELGLFFSKLLEIKYFVKEKVEQGEDDTLKEILEKLDAIIKEKGNA